MTFTGFPRGGVAFFKELAVRQDREWFKAHKQDYEALWQAPMAALFEELKAGLSRVYPDVKGQSPKVFRIYRDVRFAKDKSPFNTQVSAVLPLSGRHEGPMSSSALYCAFGKDAPFMCAGRYMMDPPRLKRWRAAVAGEEGAALARVMARLARKGFSVVSIEQLKRAPPGVAADHPRVELLRHKGFAVVFPPRSPSALHDGKALVRGVIGDAKAVAPVLAWMEAAVHGKALPAL